MVTRVVTKQLIGIEDLLLGTGNVNQTRASGTVSMTKIDSKGLIHTVAETLDTKLGKKGGVVNTIADMKTIGSETIGQSSSPCFPEFDVGIGNGQGRLFGVAVCRIKKIA